MKIDMTNWANFIVDDLFEIINGKGITVEEIESNPGDFEAVQSGEGNNGVMGYISKAYCRNKGYSYCEEACLTVARSGTSGYVSFHENGCVVGDSAKVLLLKKHEAKSKQTYLFLQTLLAANRFKYTYGRKVTEALYSNTVIKLPVTTSGEPDWQWMKSYINSLHSKELSTNNAATINFQPLAASDWHEFTVNNLFDSIYKVASYHDDDLTNNSVYDENTVAYVTRTDQDNSVKSLIRSAGLAYIEPGNVIVVGDTTSTISYQPNPFVAGEHIIAARASWLNKYTGLFVTCLLRQERYRYSYGRAYKLDLIRNTKLKLPVTPEGKPDWQYMENYIKSLPYGDRL